MLMLKELSFEVSIQGKNSCNRTPEPRETPACHHQEGNLHAPGIVAKCLLWLGQFTFFYLLPRILWMVPPPAAQECPSLGGILYGHSTCIKPKSPEWTQVYLPPTLGFALVKLRP